MLVAPNGGQGAFEGLCHQILRFLSAGAMDTAKCVDTVGVEIIEFAKGGGVMPGAIDQLGRGLPARPPLTHVTSLPTSNAIQA